MAKFLFSIFFIFSCSSNISPTEKVSEVYDGRSVLNIFRYQPTLTKRDVVTKAKEIFNFEIKEQFSNKEKVYKNEEVDENPVGVKSYFFNYRNKDEKSSPENLTAIKLLKNDVANINRNLGWFLTASLSFLAIAIGMASLIGVLTFRQNNKLTKLHDDYEDKLSELNHKSLEFVDKSNEIALLERKNGIMLEVFLTNSIVTRAYMLIPKLEGVLKQFRTPSPLNDQAANDTRNDLSAYANELLDEMNLYADRAYEKLHGLRREIKVNYSQEDDIFFELINLFARVRLFIGLCAKRRYELNGNKSLLIEAESELKRCVADDFPFLTNETDKARVYYNLACYLSLSGKFDESLKFLKLSWALNSRYTEASKKDKDLSSLVEARPEEFTGSAPGELL